MPEQKVLESLRAQLEEERASLQHQLEELGAGDKTMSFDENFADSDQVAAEQGENRLVVSTLTEQLADVEKALAKMDDGEYGKCETCGKEIAEPRL